MTTKEQEPPKYEMTEPLLQFNDKIVKLEAIPIPDPTFTSTWKITCDKAHSKDLYHRIMIVVRHLSLISCKEDNKEVTLVIGFSGKIAKYEIDANAFYSAMTSVRNFFETEEFLANIKKDKYRGPSAESLCYSIERLT